ncbi:hypothetical protein E8E11_000109 [Didymella keratinophila]|nr:hypothetical protein E8E11_000109 [Didymella keratinophila]
MESRNEVQYVKMGDEGSDELQLTSINTENHVYETPSTTSRTYYLIHAILQLSTAYLYPEYLPTYGFGLEKPQGPMNAPLVTEAVPEDQPNYWEDKAEECFEYVRDFVSMLRSFKDRDLIVESPFIAHAVYKAAWCAMYCFHVPKMDPSRALDAKLEPNAWYITNQVLGSMRRKFKLTEQEKKDAAIQIEKENKDTQIRDNKLQIQARLALSHLKESDVTKRYNTRKKHT